MLCVRKVILELARLLKEKVEILISSMRDLTIWWGRGGYGGGEAILDINKRMA